MVSISVPWRYVYTAAGAEVYCNRDGDITYSAYCSGMELASWPVRPKYNCEPQNTSFPMYTCCMLVGKIIRAILPRTLQWYSVSVPVWPAMRRAPPVKIRQPPVALFRRSRKIGATACRKRYALNSNKLHFVPSKESISSIIQWEAPKGFHFVWK